MNNKTTITIIVIIVVVLVGVLAFNYKKVAKAPTGIPSQIIVSGVGECLPHRNTSGPQTMECAFGLAVDQDAGHYALDLQAIKDGQMSFETGKHIRVEGSMVPKEQLNTDMWNKYNIEGIIKVNKIEKI